MLAYSEVLSTLALVVSLVSFFISARSAFLDQPRLKISACYFEGSEYGAPRIVVTLVNRGRRPVILRSYGGSDANGKMWSGTYFDHDKGGLRLGEHERHDLSLTKEDTMSFNPGGEDLIFETLWIEDSLGVRHKVPSSPDLLRRIWS